MSYFKKREKQKSFHTQMRFLTQSSRLEERENLPLIRLTVITISLVIFAIILWSSIAKISEVARAPGEVVPYGLPQTVQTLEGGMVAKIDVVEGSSVKAGQVLLVMDGLNVKSELERVSNKQQILSIQAERLRAFLEGREPDFTKFGYVSPQVIEEQRSIFKSMVEAKQKEKDILTKQIEQKTNAITGISSELKTSKDNLKIAQNLYDRRKKLHAKGVLADAQLLESERDLNALKGLTEKLTATLQLANNEHDEYTRRLTSLEASNRDGAFQRVDEVESEMNLNKELMDKLKSQVERLDVKAPVDGIIKGLNINTLGSVVQPGQVLMEIIPTNKPMIISAKVDPKYIGHLKIGQPVRVKFSSYDFSRYGVVPGILHFVSATTFYGDSGEKYYQAQIILERQYVGYDTKNHILPGMTVMADIITGEKTVMAYLLKPIHVSLMSAFTER